jgi:hypothetical protein
MEDQARRLVESVEALSVRMVEAEAERHAC